VTPALEAAPGVELAYEERGSGAPVVLVHGTGATRGFWTETLAALGDDVRALAYDRRGYGDSGAPEGYTATTVGEHADDLAALIGVLGDGPAVVCGHSFGAIVALDLLLHQPELVRAAVLIDPGLLWLAPSGAQEASEARAAAEAAAGERGPTGLIDAFIEGTCGPGFDSVLGPERMAAAHAHPVAFVAELTAAANWSPAPRELRALDARVTLLAGRRSKQVWHEVADALAAMLPNAQLRWADAGHLLPIEAPDATADAIREAAQLAPPAAQP
jgi:pimeloyl-ACP methyl ester carboxylesterase